MKKCPKCKHENDDESFFCTECGAKLKKKPNIWIFVSIILLIVVLILWANLDAYIHDVHLSHYEIHALRSQIERLEPKVYYTKYNNQRVYHYYDGRFHSTAQYGFIGIPNRGTSVFIYTEMSNYGLTTGGWIPMDCLEATRSNTNNSDEAIEEVIEAVAY